MLCGLGFHMEIKKEIFKNILVPKRTGYSFPIWHVTSSSGPLPKYFRLWPCFGNLHYGIGVGFHIEIKKETFNNLLVQNRKDYNFHICHVVSSSGPLPKYFRLWPCCGNLHNAVGLAFYIEIKKETLKNILALNPQG